LVLIVALWTEGELTVLVVIYMNNSFSIGDDAREENHLIAESFGRRPSAVDRQWRNVKDIFEGTNSSNVGQKVKGAVYSYMEDPASCEKLARYYCTQNRWQLDELLSGTFTPAPAAKSPTTSHERNGSSTHGSKRSKPGAVARQGANRLVREEKKATPKRQANREVWVRIRDLIDAGDYEGAKKIAKAKKWNIDREIGAHRTR
jgi:hypothetical protein